MINFLSDTHARGGVAIGRGHGTPAAGGVAVCAGRYFGVIAALGLGLVWVVAAAVRAANATGRRSRGYVPCAVAREAD